ncbi:M14 metallopeptidase family protein [Marinicella rhabdoformis]|uniref:M14 metallopeptidase family protein n=1 Tax=Marinicella rhabdoformis TaxID=2580566 RepID=UPI0015D04B72|nr:M14 metallopeptidase family protein [Marinicella rhabdoformis]
MPTVKCFYALMFFCTAGFQSAEATKMFWPNVNYDPDIPTIEAVLSYAAGERITNHRDMLAYFDALEHAAPDRIKKFSYGKTWEGRELIYLVLGSEENLAKLTDFERDIQLLADPRQTNKSAASLMKSMPAAVWLGYGVHGNEISSTDAAMMTAYHLLASPDHPMTQQIMANTLVFIDPLQNPDGRERFTSRYYASVGLEHSTDRYSAEHNEPWPQGRSNHYLFDMNRDWLAMTQPETQGRIAIMNRFLPLVVIDLHEMGSDSSYYFAPPAEPINPLMTQAQLDNITTIGKNHAKHFDAMGYDYFTREVFDAFYPGYGDSWPTFYGASASTYEVASSRGEVIKRKDGSLYTYADSVQKHFVASVSTIEATAKNREKLLKDFYQFQISAVESGKKSKSRYHIIPKQSDRAGTFHLAKLLSAHGLEVMESITAFKACGQTIDSGSFVVDRAQPKGRLLEVLMRQQVDMDKAFIKKQEDRRSQNLRDEIYDLTAWSLPLMHNIDAVQCGSVNESVLMDFKSPEQLPALMDATKAKVAYLVPWQDMAAGRFLTEALRQGIQLKSSDLPFTMASGASYPAGTLIIEVKNNSTALAGQVRHIADNTGAKVDAVDSSWVSEGPNFGSGNVVAMKAPKIAMAWDEPTSSLSAGNSRFVIERQIGYPVTAIRSEQLGYMNLSDYDVLILPSGFYGNAFGEGEINHLTDWVSDGGVLVTFGAATAFAASEKVGWLSVKSEHAFKENDDKVAKETGDSVAGSLIDTHEEWNERIQSEQSRPDSVAGVLVNVSVDQKHWLTAGIKPDVVAMVTGSRIYSPITLDKGKNVASFKSSDELLASGYLWEENRKQLAFKPFLIHQPKGRGMVIAFTQEPTMRAFLDGLQLLLTNTLFRSVAHSGKGR